MKMIRYLTVIVSLFSFCSYAAPAKDSLIGTVKSFRYAFNMALSSDGNEAEEWNVLIAKTMGTHPTNFLRVLQENEDKVKRLDSMVATFGDELVDDYKAQRGVAEERIAALTRVKNRSQDPDFVRLAEKCIKILKQI